MSDEDIISVSATEPVHGIQIGNVVLVTHGPSICKDDPFCCVHRPSPHHMREWPQNWRSDKGLMERICPHGIGHPDPDDIDHKRRTQGKSFAGAMAVHGCDGCCRVPKEDKDAV